MDAKVLRKNTQKKGLTLLERCTSFFKEIETEKKLKYTLKNWFGI
jgi:hypothetical protein